ncbi:MAG TPA: hypothetical protein PK668_11320 [Myxococcota bacterium]|nr:hypothetical protein [Myxococcota bacterium]HRY93244.1 hypothetical protein [Myxococcota bacterium]HSA20690.1 hypothetical protein [Myxococcota bacterium]
MKCKAFWTSVALCACFGPAYPSEAQEADGLTVVVQPAKPGPLDQAGSICVRTLHAALIRASMEVTDRASKGDVDHMTKGLGTGAEDEDFRQLAALSVADVVIRYELAPERVEAGVQRLRLRLEALEPLTSRQLGNVVRPSVAFVESPGELNRRAEQVCAEAGAELLALLQGYRDQWKREGPAVRLEVRAPPNGLGAVLVSTLEKICTGTKLEEDGDRRVVASAHCTEQNYEVSKAVVDELQARFPKRGCNTAVIIRQLILLRCMP